MGGEDSTANAVMLRPEPHEEFREHQKARVAGGEWTRKGASGRRVQRGKGRHVMKHPADQKWDSE